MFASSYSFSDFRFELDNLAGSDLVLTSSDLSLDLRNISGLSFSGHISVSYNGFTANLALSYIDSTLTVGIDGQFISIQASSISDIYSVLRSAIPSLPDLESALSQIEGMDLSSILNMIASIGFQQNKISDGFEYMFNIDSLLGTQLGSLLKATTDKKDNILSLGTNGSLNIGKTLDEISKFIDLLNQSGANISVDLSSVPEIIRNIDLNLAAQVSENSIEESTVQQIASETVPVDNITSGLLQAYSTLSAAPRLQADFELTYSNTATSSSKKATGNIQADIPSFSNIDQGKFRLNLDAGSFTDEPVSLAYENSEVYLTAGSVLKGRIDNATIQTLINALTATTQSVDSEAVIAIDSLDTILKSPVVLAVQNLISSFQSGFNFDSEDLQTVLSLFDDVTFGSDYISVALSCESVGIGTGDINLTVGFGGELGISYIELGNIHVGDSTIGFRADLKTLEPLTQIDPTGYVDFSVLPNTIGQLMNIVDTKQIAADYSVSVSGIQGLDNGLNVTGSLAADLSGYELPDLNGLDLSAVNPLLDSLNGLKARLTAASNVGGSDISLDARILDQGTAYLAVDQLGTKAKMNNAGLKDLIDFVLTNLGIQSGSAQIQTMALTEESSDILSQVLTELENFVYDASTMTVKLSEISKLIQVSPIEEGGTLISIDPEALGYDFGVIDVTLDENGLLSTVSLEDLSIDSATLNLSLKLKDYDESWVELTDEEKAEYGDADFVPAMGGSIISLLEGRKASLNLDASVNNIGIKGKVNADLSSLDLNSLDLNNLDLPGLASTAALNGEVVIDLDENSYDPRLDFALDNGDLRAVYSNGGEENGNTINIKMGVNEITETVGIISNVFGNEAATAASTLDATASLASISLEEYSELESQISEIYSAIHSVKVNDNSVTVELDPSFIGITGIGEDAPYLKATIKYDESTGTALDAELTGTVSGLAIDGSINVASYDDSYTNKLAGLADGDYIDLNTLPTLLQLGLNTAENRTATFKGTLDLNIAGKVEATVLFLNPKVDFSKSLNPELTISINLGADASGALTPKFYIRSDINGHWTEIINTDTGDFLVSHFDGTNTSLLKISSAELTTYLPLILLGYIFDMEQGGNIDLVNVPLINTLPLPLISTLYRQVLNQFYPSAAVENSAVSTLAEETADTETESQDQGGIAGSSIKPEEILEGFTYDSGTGIYDLALNLGGLISMDSTSDDMKLSLGTVNLQMTKGTNEKGEECIGKITLPSTDLAKINMSIGNQEISGITIKNIKVENLTVTIGLNLERQAPTFNRYNSLLNFYTSNIESINSTYSSDGYYHYGGYTENGNTTILSKVWSIARTY